MQTSCEEKLRLDCDLHDECDAQEEKEFISIRHEEEYDDGVEEEYDDDDPAIDSWKENHHDVENSVTDTVVISHLTGDG